MKKFFVCCLSLIIALSFFIMPQNTFAQSSFTPVVADVEEYLDEFLDNFKDRTSFSQAEKDAAQWIAQEFESFGLETKVQHFELEFNAKKVTSQNVIGKLDFGKPKQVIICVNYDNVYGSADIEGVGAEGAYSSGASVAVLLSLAKQFALQKAQDEINLDYNIIFLALGAEEVGLYGSSYYVKHMLPKEISNTLLAVNLDHIGGGDYLYLYCDELSTIHEKFIKQIADNNGLNLRLPPANKKTMSALSPLIPYWHYGLNSANVRFIAAGINSANFFSGNWHTNNKIGMVESEKNPPIIYTKDDNRKTLKSLYGDSFIQKTNATADIIYYTLINADFVKTMEQSAINRPNYSWLVNESLVTYIKLGLIIIMVTIVILLIRNLSNRYPVPVVTIKPTPPPTVFGEEYDNKSDSQQDNNQPPQNPFEGY